MATAAAPIQVGDTVKIDGKGRAIVLQKVCRGFGIFFMVNLIGIDREFEIEQEELSVVPQTASSGLSDLSMERTFLSVEVVYICGGWHNSLKQSSHFINSLTRLTLL